MEVCEICHHEITSDQKYKVYQWNRLAHLSCYNKVFWLGIKMLIPCMIAFITGFVMTLMGGIGLDFVGDKYEEMMSYSTGVALVVVGVILLVVAIVLAIFYAIKYFAIRKNPPVPTKNDGPFTPTR